MKTIIKITLKVYIYFSILFFSVYGQNICSYNNASYSKWKFTGQYNEPNYNHRGQGIIIKVIVDKNDTTGKTIYAGSRMGGLFKSIDGGQTWNCITDTLRSPGMGVNDIAIHPDSPNVIYISATNNSVSGTNPEFCVGILKSVDTEKYQSLKIKSYLFFLYYI